MLCQLFKKNENSIKHGGGLISCCVNYFKKIYIYIMLCQVQKLYPCFVVYNLEYRSEICIDRKLQCKYACLVSTVNIIKLHMFSTFLLLIGCYASCRIVRWSLSMVLSQSCISTGWIPTRNLGEKTSIHLNRDPFFLYVRMFHKNLNLAIRNLASGSMELRIKIT